MRASRGERSRGGDLRRAGRGDALQALDPIWEHLFPDEQARIVQLLVKQVEVHPDRVEVKIRLPRALSSLAAELREEQEVTA